MNKRKKWFLAGSVFAVFGLLAVGIALLVRQGFFQEKSKNLALMKGVKATCDSTEAEGLSAAMAIDGDDETPSSRWSSENNWENASHYIELEFPEEISVSFVVLKWERTNATSYRLESSMDGKDWKVLADFDQAPGAKRQEIPLAETVAARFLRLSVDGVSQAEEDYSNLYQNVSLYEFEVYADKPLAYLLDAPVIETREDGSRFLSLPGVPEDYRITYLGADYEQIISSDCEVYNTIQDKEVTVGFLVEQKDGKEEKEEIAFTIRVPAAETEPEGGNEVPQVIPAVAEWNGGDGVFTPGRDSRIIAGESLLQTAELFAAWYREIMGYEIQVITGKYEDVLPGDFYLSYASGDGDTQSDETVRGVGREGYACDINDKCVISGTDKQGIYWGTITLLQILEEQNGSIPQGRIRDYPKYEVRGFGIDVARKPVSMAMLHQIMKNMSWYKMNDLCIHLNDNVILSTSGLTDSVEEAMTAYSAFRLDTDVINGEGKRLTSSDYAYAADEFAEFIRMAEMYGVQVVPEIDTPAHSLSITKLFPEYALTVRTEAVDQIDLSKKEAVGLVKDIWQEALAEALVDASVVNVGMDEYYGDGETYRQYMSEIIEHVREAGGVETVRLWGSLSNMEGTTMPPVENLQMNIWSTIWAEPLAMYEEGYSLINMQNNHLYIIPGGGYDYLDAEELFQNWEVNKFYDYKQLEFVPAYSPQMLGAAYMIWNDMSGSLDVGISEADLFDRFYRPLGVISGKLWGEVSGSYQEWTALFDRLGTAPGSDPYAKAAWGEEALHVLSELPDSLIALPEGEEAVSLNGGGDFIETGYDGGYGNGFGVGGNYMVSMEVCREASGSLEQSGVQEQSGLQGTQAAMEQILFETDTAYGQAAFKAVQKETGQVGFSREGRDYSFAYTLPAGEWVTLTVQARGSQISLYVNGELTDTLGNEEPFEEYASFVFPLERIGSKTNGFCGMIKNVEIRQE